MVRISDILKKKMQASANSGETRPNPDQSTQVPPQKEPTPQTGQQPPKIHIAKAIKYMHTDTERSNTIYSQGIQLFKEVLDNAKEKKPIDLPKIREFVGSVVDAIVLGDKELVSLFYEPAQDSYLYSHIINVLIMSIKLGLGLAYNKSKLNELGLAAFFHDIGMIKVGKIALQSGALSEEEYNQIKKHPLYSAEILSEIKDMPEVVISVAQEEHERMNGKGYPSGRKGEEISEYARIIGVVDVYEALTHSRTYRKKYTPHDVIKELLTNHSSAFDPTILRTLINQVGIYPIGSWVELNTDEIGKVITINDKFPLKPVINLIFDSVGGRLEEPHVVNLVKQFNLSIKRPLTDEEVVQKTKEEVR